MTKYLVAKLDSNDQFTAPEVNNFFVKEIDLDFIDRMMDISLIVDNANSTIDCGVVAMEVHLESYLIQENSSDEKVTKELTELLCENNRQYAIVDDEYLKKFTFTENEDYEFAKLRVYGTRCVSFAADTEYGGAEVYTTNMSLIAMRELFLEN